MSTIKVRYTYTARRNTGVTSSSSIDMKTSRFVKPRRSESSKELPHEEPPVVALAPTESSTLCDGTMSGSPESKSSSKQDSNDSSTIEEVIIGLDQSFQASRWNAANNNASSSAVHDDPTNGANLSTIVSNSFDEKGVEDTSPNSVAAASVTGFYEIRSKDSVASFDAVTDIGDDYSAITEVYNEYDEEIKAASNKKGNNNNQKSLVAPPMLQPMLSLSPTSDDGTKDELFFPQVVNRGAKFNLLSKDPVNKSSFSTVVSQEYKKRISKENWKRVAFWLAISICWLKLAAHLREVFWWGGEEEVEESGVPIENLIGLSALDPSSAE